MLLVHAVNRLLAVVLSVALIAAAVLVGVEAVRAATGDPSWVLPWRDWVGASSDLLVGDPVVVTTSAVLAAVGLVLVLFELAPRRPSALRAEPVAQGVETVATRSGVRSTAVSAARGVAGVRGARARVVRRKVEVTVRSRARGEARSGLKEDVTRAAEAALLGLGVQRPLRVRTKVEEDR